ncbi:DCC1-like thiol-disulfide oxidoreductase family protein [Priestia flexa]|uniref:thiol-disulfide oxidoreductase DCC family protein n=1 Tax=Priestia flexa TaxID=86664 RepID=UPI00288FA55B|nr:DCC1-like thiol-disulfide oxidoreductase family protein [Priestia flexa]MDT2046559.1 DCC1-like thiol-disulfide oxidoreductase family protein [Priestia flexa]
MRKSIIFFDGDCHMCNQTILFIMNHDPKVTFYFASLQSSFAEKMRTNHRIPQEYKSIVLLQNELIYTESTAILRIVKELTGPIKYAYAFILVPRRFRDKVYDYVAKRRYKLMKNKACRLPTAEEKNRFLTEKEVKEWTNERF